MGPGLSNGNPGIPTNLEGVDVVTDIHQVRGALFGLCTGDALGLPVQFVPRERLRAHPVRGMTGYGTCNKPPGTWSDDSSLTFCLAESLCEGLDLEDIGQRFVRWVEEGYWSADGRAFDVGRTTLRAVARLKRGVSPYDSGDAGDRSNGNGSLMRILPLALYLKALDVEVLLPWVHMVSAITHAHPVSQMACGIYTVLAIGLLQGCSPSEAYTSTPGICLDLYDREPYRSYLPRFSRVLNGKIDSLPEEKINSSGYVVDTLEAALWCLLRNGSYRDTVLDGVNLGGDTDTIAAVAGGLAGVHYGLDSIPGKWVRAVARHDEIRLLADRFGAACDER